ncbi:carboxypeptidase-like regulatory domain-containing protein [Chryseobacterium sp. SSA4.19]|uniref:carboxypeptidase-like regulatory domain-containing protein n=1 Tax=Chryseobacterium sp. SSA4.19 TaxID=2919915 RepID=UPI001F4D37F9|nr:carboxypeptidase-like regulatory domain-containing protein [Chryseobacterium sp. SSA4.19]MCJ8154263.1 carboxypeptidase-like regulatory domain-containing protein [Chryseobacterium sp. SSA4.19]
MEKLRFLIILLFTVLFSPAFSQIIKGKITDEEGIDLPAVAVINMSTDEKVSTLADGTFSIAALHDDEIRFVKTGYERASIKASHGVGKFLLIRLIRVARDIEEVKVTKITGDLNKDAKAAARTDQRKMVQDAVGLPQPVGKMREKPAEVKEVLVPIILGQLNVQGMYDLISGKARRQKRQYRYDDLQEDIAWIRNRVDDEYFTKEGIPEERISEFIGFSFLTRPQTRTFVRAKNLAGALSRMDGMIKVFTTRLNESKR